MKLLYVLWMTLILIFSTFADANPKSDIAFRQGCRYALLIAGVDTGDAYAIHDFCKQLSLDVRSDAKLERVRNIIIKIKSEKRKQ